MEQNLRQRVDKWYTDGSAMRVDGGEEWRYNVYASIANADAVTLCQASALFWCTSYKIEVLPIIDKKSKRMKFP